MWETVKLGDVIEKAETVNPTSQFPNDTFEYIDVSSVSNEHLAIQETQTVIGKDAPSRARRRVNEGDIIFATVRPTLKRVAVVPKRLDGQICSTGYIVLKSKRDILLPRYLFYWMSSQSVMNCMASMQSGASYPAVTERQVKEIQIPLPPLAEQKRIVERLDKAFAEIDKGIATAKAKEEIIYALKTSLLSLWLARDNWEKVRLGNICTLRNGRAYKKQELLSRGKYPVLRVGNFFTSNHWYYSDLELDETKYCDTGDLLYAWSASFGPRIWKSGKVIYHYHIWRIDVDKRKADRKFLYYWLEHDKELVKSQSGTGSTMTHVSKTSMEERVLSLPSLDEQREIVNKLDFAFSRIESAHHWLEACINNYSALKAAVLKQELTPSEAV